MLPLLLRPGMKEMQPYGSAWAVKWSAIVRHFFHTTSGRRPRQAWQPLASSKWGKTTVGSPTTGSVPLLLSKNVPHWVSCTLFQEGLSRQNYCEQHPLWGSHQTSRKHVHRRRCGTIILQGCIEHWISHIADLQSFLDGGTYPTTDPCEKILDHTSESAMLHAEDPAQVLTMVDHE